MFFYYYTTYSLGKRGNGISVAADGMSTMACLGVL